LVPGEARWRGIFVKIDTELPAVSSTQCPHQRGLAPVSSAHVACLPHPGVSHIVCRFDRPKRRPQLHEEPLQAVLHRSRERILLSQYTFSVEN